MCLSRDFDVDTVFTLRLPTVGAYLTEHSPALDYILHGHARRHYNSNSEL